MPPPTISLRTDNRQAHNRDKCRSNLFEFSKIGPVAMRLLPICLLGVLGALCVPVGVLSQEQYFIELSSGMRLGPGVPSVTDSISTNAFQRGGSGEVQIKSIGILDDGLRLTFYNQSQRNVLRVEESTLPPQEELELASAAEAARSGNPPSILGILGVSQFNKYGRRTYSFMTTRGQVSVLQGITLLTPTFAKVEILRTRTGKFVWDSRIATSSIPAKRLREILEQALDLTKSSDWLRMVSFYTQAGRFGEAREIMFEALQNFPSELADRRPVLDQLDQLLANQKFTEIKLRKESGQQKLATNLLFAFPVDQLPLETQLRINNEVQQLQQELLVIADATTALKECVAALPEPDQQVVAPLIEEMLNQLSLETVVRLADFYRLRADESIPNENKVALALSGWLLGSGAGMDNFAVVKSLLRVRVLVKEYLNDASSARRRDILAQLKSEEGAQPQVLDQLLETMQPPQSPPPHLDQDPVGMFRLSVQIASGQTVNYLVQVPPEYDPNRKYPCVLALPAKGDPPDMEIDWWCGLQMPVPSGGVFRFGQATRYGYIVVSPQWMTNDQTSYQYTENEHARVLGCLRDAFRKFSIDTDRVFVSGHYDGATAAWDLAVAHPDLWAGAIMISPGCDKYIVQYSENVQGKTPNDIPLGTYVVYGESDGTRNDSQLGRCATRYLVSPTYDSLVVEYRGRGRERFAAELPRIMEWMQLSSHRRIRIPRNIETTTMRPGDRFFYWLEAPQILANVAGNPYEFDPAAKGTFEAKVLDQTINGVNISRIPSVNRGAVVWLTPEMVDFSRTVTVSLQGKRHRNDVSPDIQVMLEDVRRRGDRMHVFWQRIPL